MLGRLYDTFSCNHIEWVRVKSFKTYWKAFSTMGMVNGVDKFVWYMYNILQLQVFIFSEGGRENTGIGKSVVSFAGSYFQASHL